MKAPTIDDSCCFIDIIDECIKELTLETQPTIKLVEFPPTTMLEEDEADIYRPYVEDSLR